jgi:hypothetical protein
MKNLVTHVNGHSKRLDTPSPILMGEGRGEGLPHENVVERGDMTGF